MTEYPKPQDEIVAEMVVHLGAALREEFLERAAIREIDAGLERSLAEAMSLLEVIRRHGWPPRTK